MRFLVLSAALALAVPPAAQGDGLRGDGTPGAPPASRAMPVCDAAQEGAAACLAGRQCLCRRERDGPSPRWDCGILRPSCAEVPAGLAQAEAGPVLFPQVTGPDWPLAEERGARRRGAPKGP